MPNYSLFSVVGIEIEYMLVDRDTLNVSPCSDVILHTLANAIVNEVELGDIAASNELVMHVLELKNNGPKPPDSDIANQFQQTITSLQPLLRQHHLQLLPTGAHPWMNPLQETKRWPYGNKTIYQQYDRLFNCQGHGWANLQSMHVNLPFANDEEFTQLHALIRLILPLIPALAASTPLLESKPSGYLDTRLQFYGKNQQRFPRISGEIIPEIIQSPAEYQSLILEPMYEEIAPFDREGILQHEWLNSRGAIAKFESMAIEIRIIDSQECVDADIAIAKAIVAILKDWHRRSDFYLQKPCAVTSLKTIYDSSIKQGLTSLVEDKNLLEQWQLPRRAMSIRHVLGLLIERISSDIDHKSQHALERILSQGNLSERILRACGNHITNEALLATYQQLADCLVLNEGFNP